MNFFGYLFGCLIAIWVAAYVVSELPKGFLNHWWAFPAGVTGGVAVLAFGFLCGHLTEKVLER